MNKRADKKHGKKELTAVQASRRTVVAVSEHRGPLPSPEDLLKYDQICPGAAERIISMAESELKAINKLRIKEYKSFRLGVILGFIILLCLIILTAYALYIDKPWVAGVLIATVSACSLFASKKDSK